MTVINFDEIIGKGNNYITNNIFCIKHPTNCLITSVKRQLRKDKHTNESNCSKLYIR